MMPIFFVAYSRFIFYLVLKLNYNRFKDYVAFDARKLYLMILLKTQKMKF